MADSSRDNGTGASTIESAHDYAAIDAVLATVHSLTEKVQSCRPLPNLQDLTPEQKQSVKEQVNQMMPMLGKMDRLVPVFFALKGSRKETARLILLDQVDALKHEQYTITPENLTRLNARLQLYFMRVRSEITGNSEAESGAASTSAQSTPLQSRNPRTIGADVSLASGVTAGSENNSALTTFTNAPSDTIHQSINQPISVAATVVSAPYITQGMPGMGIKAGLTIADLKLPPRNVNKSIPNLSFSASFRYETGVSSTPNAGSPQTQGALASTPTMILQSIPQDAAITPQQRGSFMQLQQQHEQQQQQQQQQSQLWQQVPQANIFAWGLHSQVPTAPNQNPSHTTVPQGFVQVASLNSGPPGPKLSLNNAARIAATATVQSMIERIQASRVPPSLQDLTPEQKQSVKEQTSQMMPMFEKIDKLVPVFFALNGSREATARLILMKFMFQDQLDALKHEQYTITPENLTKLKERLQFCFMWVRSEVASNSAAASGAAAAMPQSAPLQSGNPGTIGMNVSVAPGVTVVSGNNTAPPTTFTNAPSDTIPNSINQPTSVAATVVYTPYITQGMPGMGIKAGLTIADLKLPPRNVNKSIPNLSFSTSSRYETGASSTPNAGSPQTQAALASTPTMILQSIPQSTAITPQQRGSFMQLQQQHEQQQQLSRSLQHQQMLQLHQSQQHMPQKQLLLQQLPQQLAPFSQQLAPFPQQLAAFPQQQQQEQLGLDWRTTLPNEERLGVIKRLSDALKAYSPTIADTKIVELAKAFENVTYQRSPNK
ncbi:AT rich interactive domain 5A (MRF1-like) [Linnemannia zychae]|nr:AT rich interactive domain 5A (MRF1-like) [Linnemannia zychae]